MIGKSTGVFSKKPLKTSIEQALLRNIQALEQGLAGADENRKAELESQIGGLKSSLASIQKQQEQKYSFSGKSQKAGQTTFAGSSKTGSKQEFELKLCLFLLEKYSDIINDFEKKTVGEIKALVDPNDLSVQSLALEFKKENFVFKKHYLETAKKAFDFVQKEISYVKLGTDLNFWLSPKEILQEKIGDDKDLSVFLCSLLSGFEDQNCEVIVAEMSDGQTHAFVTTEFNDTFFIFDPSQTHGFYEYSGKKSEVLEKYSFGNSKIVRFIYRFNRQKYEQFF